MAAVPTLHINVKFGAQKVATGGTLTCQLHITDSFTLEAAPLTKPPALRGVVRLKACLAREVKVLSRHALSGL